MRNWHLVWAATAIVLASCDVQPRPPAARGERASGLDPARAAAIDDSVRDFAASVARGITQEGPGAWRGFLLDDAAFFMASEGRIVFPNGDAAARAIPGLVRAIAHIELRWGDGLRVDALAPGLAMLAAPYYELRVDTAGRRVEEIGFFTGLAEHRAVGWRLRDAHWSLLAPAPHVP
ncbi:MAG TPA: hypothetical protein VHE78_14080 [Gemmatimonadaceae bacterium]|nr:hypothetical protein [Gemmatimonadaceae bacterium]